MLYLSDLDGTLLDENAILTEFSRTTLNALIDKGMHLSIATARTAATCAKMLRGLRLTLPAILMNGVCLYSLPAQRYEKIFYFGENSARSFVELLCRYGNTGFVYTIRENMLGTYYQNLQSPHAVEFVRERETKFGKRFTKVHSFFQPEILQSTVYFSVCDREEKLRELYEDICKLHGLHAEFYRDIYHEDFFYLEVCSARASKQNAALWLKEQYGFAKITAFGDNLNDLSLFAASDTAIAVANAREEIRSCADVVISSNRKNGVAEYLLKTFQK